MRTSKVRISLCIRGVRSAHMLFAILYQVSVAEQVGLSLTLNLVTNLVLSRRGLYRCVRCLRGSMSSDERPIISRAKGRSKIEEPPLKFRKLGSTVTMKKKIFMEFGSSNLLRKQCVAHYSTWGSTTADRPPVLKTTFYQVNIFNIPCDKTT